MVDRHLSMMMTMVGVHQSLSLMRRPLQTPWKHQVSHENTQTDSGYQKEGLPIKNFSVLQCPSIYLRYSSLNMSIVLSRKYSLESFS